MDRFNDLAKRFGECNRRLDAPEPIATLENEEQRVALLVAGKTDPEKAWNFIKDVIASGRWQEYTNFILRNRHRIFAEDAEDKAFGELIGGFTGIHLQNLAVKRAGLIQTEADRLLEISHLSRERVSLLFRYRQPIYGDDVAATLRDIDDSLDQSAEVENWAAMRVVSLNEVPQADAARNGELREKILTASRESQRLLSARKEGLLLPPAELAAFHSMYQTPAVPAAAFALNTVQISDTYLSLAETAMDRAEHAMTYVGAIDMLVKPQFPEKTDLYTQDERNSLAETRQALLFSAEYLKRAERYAAKPGPG